MAQSLHYFVSSLPLLRPGERPFLSHARLLQDCRDQLAPSQADAIAGLALDPADCRGDTLATARRWRDFETLVRNTAARLRAARLGRPAPEPRPTPLWDQHLTRLVEDAFACPSPQERETRLDQARWQALDDLEAGHAFDLEAVAVYALKLLLLERIASRQPDNAAFDALVEFGAQQAEEHRSEA